jgi:hypothetical protein
MTAACIERGVSRVLIEPDSIPVDVGPHSKMWRKAAVSLSDALDQVGERDVSFKRYLPPRNLDREEAQLVMQLRKMPVPLAEIESIECLQRLRRNRVVKLFIRNS